MLAFLVTSAVRRRLLELLWAYGATGTASELARRARVSFAAAYRELKRMASFGLVETRIVDGREVYLPATGHPDADLMRGVVQARVGGLPPADAAAHAVRRRACALGAPLPVEPDPSAELDREQAVVDAVALARRDATLARVLPVMLWLQRDHLDREQLEIRARAARQKHVLGFLLHLTAELARDRSLRTWAQSLRDRRARGTRRFFTLPGVTGAREPRRTPAIARHWGFTLDLDLEAFRTQFDKFRRPSA